MKKLYCVKCPDVNIVNNKYYCGTIIMKFTNSVPSFSPDICGDRVYKSSTCKHGYTNYPKTKKLNLGGQNDNL